MHMHAHPNLTAYVPWMTQGANDISDFSPIVHLFLSVFFVSFISAQRGSEGRMKPFRRPYLVRG